MAYFHPQRAQMLNHGGAQDTAAVAPLTTNSQQFDFGSGMPLPPPTARHRAAVGDGDGAYLKQEPEDDLFHHSNRTADHVPGDPPRRSTFRNFARGADMELLDYLRERKISPSFLNEIDQFLSAHPEIAVHRPQFVETINYSSPVDAYRFFIRGYTKPARYVDGALPDISNFPLTFEAMPLVQKEDPELREFFTGYQYRDDILLRIDQEVHGIAAALYTGQEVTMAARKLVVLAWYGNLVDAYKFYEYNFQTEWLAHRHLPEHIILTQIPKAVGYTQPVPRVIAYEGEDCQEEMRSHPRTRARMARACDAGVDVIDVLLQDFSSALVRQGLTRTQIERMKQDAVRNIDYQREIGGGRDIVDMVMNRALVTKPSDFGQQASKKISRASKIVNGLKHTLGRLVAQEAALRPDEPDFVRLHNVKLRQRVERELVYSFTKLAVHGGTMTRADRVRWMEAYNIKQQVARENAGQRIDLLAEFALG